MTEYLQHSNYLLDTVPFSEKRKNSHVDAGFNLQTIAKTKRATLCQFLSKLYDFVRFSFGSGILIDRWYREAMGALAEECYEQLVSIKFLTFTIFVQRSLRKHDAVGQGRVGASLVSLRRYGDEFCQWNRRAADNHSTRFHLGQIRPEGRPLHRLFRVLHRSVTQR